ncbi:hypothetical protein [Veillonella agrestimuris]|uniref:hypothetical protein n=1 Tax=Veillonella agrestimuris TaxID=2941340 RepID=UPI00203BC43C|nr:hypothetical protein [Veillonella agrestimuris]
MQFECYDVLEIQGKRYVITEKITYWESNEGISSSESNPYRRNKKSEYWHEYGMISLETKERWWLTITDDTEQATLSQSSELLDPPAGYHLCEQGLQEVTSVNGKSDAARGDKADYRAYEFVGYEKTLVFFREDWHGGNYMYAEGERIPLSQIRRCKDTAALKVGKKERNKYRLEVGAYSFVIVAFIVVCLGAWLTDGKILSWRGFREVIHFPYTMEEHIGEVSFYKKGEVKGSTKVFSTERDPVSVALDLIDAIDGKIDREIENITFGKEQIVLWTRYEICMIYQQEGTTYVEFSKPSEVNREMLSKIEAVSVTSDWLQRYAKIVRTNNKNGRNELFNINLNR